MSAMLTKLQRRNFQVLALHHAEAILRHDLEAVERELEKALLNVKIPAVELIRGGGGESDNTQRLRNALSQLGWAKTQFTITKTINGRTSASITHEIDHVRQCDLGTVALEIEWNNKDPFFDRDLENFKRLHAEGAISVGVIVTRGESLQEALRDIVERFAQKHGIRSLRDLSQFYTPTPRQRTAIARAAESLGCFEKGWAKTFVSDKFGEATTHWRKLRDRVDRGVGNPCPLVLIGLPRDIVLL
jgi:hypothetical protein